MSLDAAFELAIDAKLTPVLDRLSSLEQSGDRQAGEIAAKLRLIADAVRPVQERIVAVEAKVEMIDGLERARSALDAKFSEIATEIIAIRKASENQAVLNRKFGGKIDALEVFRRDLETMMNPTRPRVEAIDVAPVRTMIDLSVPPPVPVASPSKVMVSSFNDLLALLGDDNPVVPAVAASSPRATSCTRCGSAQAPMRGMCVPCAQQTLGAVH